METGGTSPGELAGFLLSFVIECVRAGEPLCRRAWDDGYADCPVRRYYQHLGAPAAPLSAVRRTVAAAWGIGIIDLSQVVVGWDTDGPHVAEPEDFVDVGRWLRHQYVEWSTRHAREGNRPTQIAAPRVATAPHTARRTARSQVARALHPRPAPHLGRPLA